MLQFTMEITKVFQFAGVMVYLILQMITILVQTNTYGQ